MGWKDSKKSMNKIVREINKCERPNSEICLSVFLTYIETEVCRRTDTKIGDFPDELSIKMTYELCLFEDKLIAMGMEHINARKGAQNEYIG